MFYLRWDDAHPRPSQRVKIESAEAAESQPLRLSGQGQHTRHEQQPADKLRFVFAELCGSFLGYPCWVGQPSNEGKVGDPIRKPAR